ncbi:prolipoprotein diacylglyceryl transferase [Roseimaritima sediminicola]|uniref:prolipoprotein diacylglyceryl transferase n=1 Tax=Roseimaritima sediminicola TaxID=2662066 RepID=UPI00129824FC|nr:prolipoprotein diacylglyceryl transferase family protein [Roseimaritima sediminicola]
MTVRPLYAAVMLLAVMVGVVLLRLRQRPLGLDAEQRWMLGIGAFTGGMIAAKLPYLVSGGLQSGWVPGMWLADGKTILAGIVGAYFGVEVAKWACSIRIKTGDSFALPAAVAVGIGRIGCYVGGCCFGTVTALPWGQPFAAAGDSLPRHPTQLYEAAFHFGFAIILWQLGRRGWLRLQHMKLYLIGYLVYRFATEFIRPEPHVLAGLTAYQLATVPLLVLFSWLWWRDRQDAAIHLSRQATVR